MDYVVLGRKSGLKVSKVGLGFWQASSDWKGADAQLVGAAGKARDLGVNLIDTAEQYGYGHSESVLGAALKKYGRENFFVATKVYGAHLRSMELQKAARGSMKRLGVKEIDLYQVHWPDPWEQIPLRETMGALEKLYSEGKIRAIGVSNFAVRDLEEARSYLSKTDIVSNQLRYNLLQREIEEEVLPYCRKNGIAVLAWSPLAQGALSGKYSPGKVPSGDVREMNVLFARKNMDRIAGLNRVLSSIAAGHHRTTAQVALNWFAKMPDVIPIPGAKNPSQAAENLSSNDFKLTSREVAQVERASKSLRIDYLPDADH